mmetsp:Transcript_53334/g.152148  ORF Transcript_53334/g.152148 Transcript_53334/m.152148 type:complete len:262 (-) Transcript_53334:41-826(-)
MLHHPNLELVCKLVPVDRLAPHAVPLRDIASLAHEARDDPVEHAALVVERLAGLADPLLASGERPEVLHGLRRHAAEQLHLDAARRLAADLHVEEHARVLGPAGLLQADDRAPRRGGAAAEEAELAREDAAEDEEPQQHPDPGRRAAPVVVRGPDLHHLHREDQRGAPRDGPARRAPLAVAEGGGHEQLPLVPRAHQLHGLGPGGDDLVRGEGRRLPALVGRVELGAVHELPAVVALARGALGRAGLRLVGLLLQHLVLQP